MLWCDMQWYPMKYSDGVLDLSSFKKNGNKGHCIFFNQGAIEWD